MPLYSDLNVFGSWFLQLLNFSFCSLCAFSDPSGFCPQAFRWPIEAEELISAVSVWLEYNPISVVGNHHHI